MKLSGIEKVKLYGPEDEGTHFPGPSNAWQESVVLIWWDLKQSIGGLFRIGHEPNVGNGEITLWSTIWTDEWVYKNIQINLPLREGNRAPRYMSAGNKLCEFEFDGRCHWRVLDTEVEAKLEVEDFHPPLNSFPPSGKMKEDFASDHNETNGRVTGTLTIKGRSYTVDGLAIRDHSWGNRDWHKMLSHRWIAGNLGPNFSFCAIAYLDARQNFNRFAYVLREGHFDQSTEVEIVTYLEDDTITHRGGIVTIRLPDGELLRIQCDPVAKGSVSWSHEMATVDTLCHATCGAYAGFCDYETTTNAMQGRVRPTVGLNGYMGNGLLRAEPSLKHPHRS